MLWTSVLSDIGLVMFGGIVGFATCAVLVMGRDADRQRELVRMMDEVAVAKDND